MILKNIKVIISCLLLLGAVFVAFNSSKGYVLKPLYPKAVSEATNRLSTMETHCLGRFLIDLPKGTKVVTDYTTLGSKVQTHTSVTPEDFQERIATRQIELQDSAHSQGGSMFVERDDISANHVTLVSWSSVASHRVYRYEQYQYLPLEKILYYFTGDGTANVETRKMAAETQRKYSNKIRYRKALEVPKEEGFCICEGLILNSTLNKEEMTVGFFFPEHPDMRMSLMSFVTANDMDLKYLPNLLKMKLSGAKVLRSKNRQWGSAKAIELLLKYKDQGKWFYEFELKVQSKGNTLDQPFISISLEAGTYHGTDDKGKPMTSAFVNDKEALQFWDHIVGSLRPRPGAVLTNNQTSK